MQTAETRILRIFTHSAAALLLALATALFLINLTGPPHLVLPRDPISGLSLRYLCWIIGGLAVLIAWFCLFSERPVRTIPWVAWLAADFLIYRIALYFEGCHSLTGFLASVTYAFGLPAKAASVLVDVAFAYLLIGSCAALLWQWRHSSKNQLLQHSSTPSSKMACPACGVHIEFAAQNAGQKVPCPHCGATVTLRKPDLLKTVCFFCKGHIEFPPHAIGTRIPCPHCKMDITLKEPP
jgi:predicted RNA-binding Zn-ribbon protein involved in translation (DUF1610 family)